MRKGQPAPKFTGMKKPGPEKQFETRINVHLPTALKDRAVAEAARRDQSISEFVRAAMERELDHAAAPT